LTEEDHKSIYKEPSNHLEELIEPCYNRDLYGMNFCIDIDGSHHCEIAFDILSKEFFTMSSNVIMAYIYYSQLNNLFNYQNRKETVTDIYQTKSIRLNSKALIINEDTNNSHFIQQIYNTAKAHKSDYFICSYRGLEGPQRDKKVLIKGLNYILKEVKIPTIIIQCKASRNTERQFNWMFILDSLNQNSLKILSTYLPLVKEKDFVYCVNLIPVELKKDSYESIVKKDLSYYMISRHEYALKRVVNMDTSMKEIIEQINFGNIEYDFIVFYHYSEKLLYNYDITENSTYKFITKIKANLCINY